MHFFFFAVLPNKAIIFTIVGKYKGPVFSSFLFRVLYRLWAVVRLQKREILV